VEGMSLLNMSKMDGASGSFQDDTLGTAIDNAPGVKMAKSQVSQLTAGMWMGPWRDKFLAKWAAYRKGKGMKETVDLVTDEPQDAAKSKSMKESTGGLYHDLIENQIGMKMTSDIGKALSVPIGTHWASPAVNDVRNKIIKYIGGVADINAGHEVFSDKLLNPFTYGLGDPYESNSSRRNLQSDNNMGQLQSILNSLRKMVSGVGKGQVRDECIATAKILNDGFEKGYLSDPARFSNSAGQPHHISIDHVFLSSLGEFAGGSMMESVMLYKGYSMEGVYLIWADNLHEMFADALRKEGRQWGFVDYLSGKHSSRDKQSLDQVLNIAFTGEYKPFKVVGGKPDYSFVPKPEIVSEVNAAISSNAFGMNDALAWYRGELNDIIKLTDSDSVFNEKLDMLNERLFKSKLEADPITGLPVRSAVGKVKIAEYNKLEVLYARLLQGDIDCNVELKNLWPVPLDATAMMHLEEGAKKMLAEARADMVSLGRSVDELAAFDYRAELLTDRIRRCGNNRRADKEALHMVKGLLSHTASPEIQINLLGVNDTYLQRGDIPPEEAIQNTLAKWGISRDQATVLALNGMRLDNGAAVSYEEIFNSMGLVPELKDMMDRVKKGMPVAKLDEYVEEFGDKIRYNFSTDEVATHQLKVLTKTVLRTYHEGVAGGGVDKGIEAAKQIMDSPILKDNPSPHKNAGRFI
jgi:hypothetical protein